MEDKRKKGADKAKAKKDAHTNAGKKAKNAESKTKGASKKSIRGGS